MHILHGSASIHNEVSVGQALGTWDGRWRVAGGRWQVAGGRWQVAGGRWRVAVEEAWGQESGVRSQDLGIRDNPSHRLEACATKTQVEDPPKEEPKTQDSRPKTQDPRPKTQDPRPKTLRPKTAISGQSSAFSLDSQPPELQSFRPSSLPVFKPSSSPPRSPRLSGEILVLFRGFLMCLKMRLIQRCFRSKKTSAWGRSSTGRALRSQRRG